LAEFRLYVFTPLKMDDVFVIPNFHFVQAVRVLYVKLIMTF